MVDGRAACATRRALCATQAAAIFAGGFVRVVFAAAAKEEAQVRALIDRALEDGVCVGPDGRMNRWTAMDQSAGVLTDREIAWGARRATSAGTA